MGRMHRIGTAAVAVAAVFAAPASAATTLGNAVTGDTSSDCDTGTLIWNTAANVVVPAGGGVVTSLSSKSASDGKHVSLKVVRPGSGTATVLGTTPLLTYAGGAAGQTGLRIPVQPGDAVAIWVGDTATHCAVNGTPDGVGGTSGVTPDPQPGTSFAFGTASGATIAVSGTMEPDADHDEFGDETQDSCPSDPSIHEGACAADIGVTASALPTTIGVGDVTVVTASVTNAAAGTAQGITLLSTPTPGLSIATTSLGSSCVFVAALSCQVGSLAGGATQSVLVVVRGVASGAHSISFGLTSTSSDPNAANNTATQAVTVERRVPLVCTVPKLTGLTKAFARTLLQAVHCKLGKATKKKARKGRAGTVIKQSKKPKSVLKAGSKVNVTLKK